MNDRPPITPEIRAAIITNLLFNLMSLWKLSFLNYDIVTSGGIASNRQKYDMFIVYVVHTRNGNNYDNMLALPFAFSLCLHGPCTTVNTEYILAY